jgi:methyl-accepting chemotaxis protein
MIVEKKKNKAPITQEKIFKFMFFITIAVSAIFLLKNLLGGAMQEAIMIGSTVAVFGLVFLVLHLRKAKETTKQLVLAISLMVLIFVIALNSGDYYSDDFIMFLAVIALTGLYLEPKYSIVQLILATIFLIAMYVINPNKADPLPQYIQCLGEFSLTGVLFIQTIKRGKAFIGIGEDRAKEAEELVESMKDMGEELDHDFAKSSARINNNTAELQKGSRSIVDSALNMQGSCDDVQDRIIISQQSITELNEQVNRFEIALRENQANIANVEQHLAAVTSTVNEANEVFQMMEQKMGEVADIADQLGDISFNTTILSLNASIEAARAGESGAGFEVVASEMRQLSNNSNVFSEQVAEVVKELEKEVGETARQLKDSTKALSESKESMDELQESFERLTKQFDALYGNIATQNNNVNEVGNIFHDLRARVAEMQNYSADNQKSVGAIIDAMDLYKENIEKVIESTRRDA